MDLSYEVVSYVSDSEKMAEKLAGVISSKKHFQVRDIPSGKQSKIVELLENEMVKQGYKSRVYTAKRGWLASGLLGAGFLATTVATGGIGALFALGAMAGGAATGAGIGAHDLATLNPDFEIVKDLIDTGVTVHYTR